MKKKIFQALGLIFTSVSLVAIFITSTPLAYFSITEEKINDNFKIPLLSSENGWKPNGTAICLAINNQKYSQICSDGAGGAIIMWIDNRSGTWKVYAQRVDSSGSPRWSYNGRNIITSFDYRFTGPPYNYPQMCSDGLGGAIFTYCISENIYAKRIDSNGDTVWSKTVCNEARVQDLPQICSDGEGSAIITWQDERRAMGYDVYTQKIDPAGNVKWTINGLLICNATWNMLDDAMPDICSDGSGGAIITWVDWRIIAPMQIYAQGVDSNGTAKWVFNGVKVCNNDGLYPEICSDGDKGAIISWGDGRGVLAQRVDSNGNMLWIIDGVLIYPDSYHQVQMHNDDVGSAIFTWHEFRGGNYNIFAQRINSSGDIQWTTNGISICSAIYNQFNPQLCSDGARGAIIAWEDLRSGGNSDIYAQCVDSSGNVRWEENGLAICTATNYQSGPQLCSDGMKGAIITWHDKRSGNYDIYALNIKASELEETPFWLILLILAVLGVIIVIGTVYGITHRRRKLKGISGESTAIIGSVRDVFISYSSKDKEIADAVCHYLEEAKIKCWIAPRDTLGAYAGSITNAIENSKLMVLIFSNNANLSNQVKNEVEIAVSSGITIQPIRIEKVEPDADFKYYVKRWHWLDAIKPPLKKHLTKLVKMVSKLLSVVEDVNKE
ncbi:MAG: TIR domain-containing protein [Promethearchaeia archaeon]